MHELFESSTHDPGIYPILEKSVAGRRLTKDECLRLFESHDLLAIGRAAHAVRMRLHPKKIMTFVIDRNINYTNVCNTDCSFCAFYRKAGDADAYVRTRNELRQKIVETFEAGGSQILMQGGLNEDIPFEWYEELLRWMKSEFPNLHIHAFSPTEISFFRDFFGIPLKKVIQRLMDAGLDSIPGGGAEILVDRVRQKISPDKTSSDDWLEVMRVAHRLGLRTSATMMFGIIETCGERVEHLRRLRELQDETGGFGAFIAWTFQPANTRHKDKFVGAFEFLKTTAICRLYLDNIENYQASWVTQGNKIAQLSMFMGVNDLGSLMLEENVVAAAGTNFMYSKDELRSWVEEMGLALVQRDYYYRPWTPPEHRLSLTTAG
jgi:cyclic dehypoxanthinyl futalosine synthase